MTYEQTKLAGVVLVHMEPKADERGFFARSWCQKEFASRNLETKLVQCSISFNRRKGTMRGMHYQADPHWEVKLVRCTQGAIYDVVLDLRPESPTFRQSVGATLNTVNRDAMYVPQGCAHGFLTLEDETEVLYQISEFYHPDLSRGVRWDDPAFQIDWPTGVTVISERDRTYPGFGENVGEPW